MNPRVRIRTSAGREQPAGIEIEAVELVDFAVALQSVDRTIEVATAATPRAPVRLAELRRLAEAAPDPEAMLASIDAQTQVAVDQLLPKMALDMLDGLGRLDTPPPTVRLAGG